MKKLLFFILLFHLSTQGYDLRTDAHKNEGFLFSRRDNIDVYAHVGQCGLKENMKFSNGKTFKGLEDALRAKCPGMPDVMIGSNQQPVPFGYVTNLRRLHLFDPNEYNPEEQFPQAYKAHAGNVILVPEQSTSDGYEKTAFRLALEADSAMHPHMTRRVHNTSVLLGGVLGATISSAVLRWCKMYYLEIPLTQLPFLSLLARVAQGGRLEGAMLGLERTTPVALVAGAALRVGMLNYTARRADNFAIRVSETQVLKCALRDLQESKRELDTDIEKYVPSYVPKFLVYKLLHPSYPTISSRIAKLQAAIAQREEQQMREECSMKKPVPISNHNPCSCSTAKQRVN